MSEIGSCLSCLSLSIGYLLSFSFSSASFLFSSSFFFFSFCLPAPFPSALRPLSPRLKGD